MKMTLNDVQQIVEYLPKESEAILTRNICNNKRKKIPIDNKYI